MSLKINNTGTEFDLVMKHCEEGQTIIILTISVILKRTVRNMSAKSENKRNAW